MPLVKEKAGPNTIYGITLGLRPDDPQWKHKINKVIAENQRDINGILQGYNVPMLDQKGECDRGRYRRTLEAPYILHLLSGLSMPSVSISIVRVVARGKPALRRDRHRHFVRGDEDRLAELTVPGPELLPDAFEGRKLELAVRG